MKQIKSHDYKEVYKDLGINLNTLGCVMIDVKEGQIKVEFEESDLYYSKDNKKFWIDGFVGSKTAHLTLLYGLMKQAKEYKKYITQVLKGWSIDSIRISDVDTFDSPTEDEPYYAIIAHIAVTPELLEGHQRLELLPHINTFAGYKPHVTIAYIKKDKDIRDFYIKQLNNKLKGKTLEVESSLNLGGNK